MSHIVRIQTQVRSPSAVAAACERLKLPPPTHGTAKLFSGEATGLLIQLPGWQYPVVIDTASGNVQYDNYEGAWGDPSHMDAFFQRYAVEAARLEARKLGHTVTEQTLTDGSVKLTIQVC